MQALWHATRAECDRAQLPSFAFGPCLTAVVVLLAGAYHLNRRKTKKLLHELFGTSVSTGAISAMEKRCAPLRAILVTCVGGFSLCCFSASPSR